MAAFWASPLWVRSGHGQRKEPCPLYPPKATSIATVTSGTTQQQSSGCRSSGCSTRANELTVSPPYTGLHRRCDPKSRSGLPTRWASCACSSRWRQELQRRRMERSQDSFEAPVQPFRQCRWAVQRSVPASWQSTKSLVASSAGATRWWCAGFRGLRLRRAGRVRLSYKRVYQLRTSGGLQPLDSEHWDYPSESRLRRSAKADMSLCSWNVR